MHSDHGIWVWVIFNGFVLLMLALDLGVFHRHQHSVKVKEALIWTGIWIAVALAFAAMLATYGKELNLVAYHEDRTPMSEGRTAVLFLTAYLIEKSLSMDNIFVFLLIFRYFAIPSQYQHKTLFWGILGALVMRLTFIVGGVAVLKQLHWVAYIFGAILIYTGLKMWKAGDAEVHPEKNIVLKVFKKFMPVQHDLEDGKFVVKRDGRWFATPLLVTLVVIETTDVLFAVDSVPAVLSITTDEFIAYSSNVFAILGLRALYFALAGIMPLFKDLHYGLSFILVFVGGKMVVGEFVEMPDWMHWVSLAVVVLTLAISMATSIMRHKGELEGGLGAVIEGEAPLDKPVP
jgi:tellurite resistance protein TerC